MLIRVMYKNNKYDMVRPSLLNNLIDEGEIKMFLRSGTWAAIGVDALRGLGGRYEGPERRKSVNIFQNLQYYYFKPVK